MMKRLLTWLLLCAFACSATAATIVVHGPVKPGGAPVTVTIGDNTTGVGPHTYTGTDDTKLDSTATNTNSGSGTSFETTKYSVGAHVHGLIAFPGLSNITGPVTVTAVTLHLYLASGGGDNQIVPARELLVAAVESQATWNKYSTLDWPGSPGGLTNGTDRGASVVATAPDVDGNLGAGIYYSFTGAGLNTLVQGWINGTTPNRGLHLERTDGQNDTFFLVWTSSEGTNGQRPYLEVTYQ